MKRTALIVNVTRGPTIDAAAITKALREGKIAGAGLDVTPIEPLPQDHPLWQFPNAVIAEKLSLALPLFAQMTDDEQQRVIDALEEIGPC